MAGFQARAGAVGGVVHDISLAAWALLALTRAAGRHQVGPVDAAVVGVNVITGVPAAVTRVRQRRRDPLALLAPFAVAAAIAATARSQPRWAPAAAVALLVGLAVAERARPSDLRSP